MDFSDYKINEDLIAGGIKSVRLIHDDNQIGIMSTNDALSYAFDKDLDLVLFAENAKPPVAKVIDWQKYVYQETKNKKIREKKSRENRIETKEIHLRPVTGDHDIGIKSRKATEFLEDGNKVKVLVKFSGRESGFTDNAREVLNKFKELIKVNDISYEDIKFNGKEMGFMISISRK